MFCNLKTLEYDLQIFSNRQSLGAGSRIDIHIFRLNVTYFWCIFGITCSNCNTNLLTEKYTWTESEVCALFVYRLE